MTSSTAPTTLYELASHASVPIGTDGEGGVLLLGGFVGEGDAVGSLSLRGDANPGAVMTLDLEGRGASSVKELPFLDHWSSRGGHCMVKIRQGGAEVTVVIGRWDLRALNMTMMTLLKVQTSPGSMKPNARYDHARAALPALETVVGEPSKVKVYVSGGTNGFTAFSDLWEGTLVIPPAEEVGMVPITVSWRMLSKAGSFVGRFGHTINVANGKLYSLGGAVSSGDSSIRFRDSIYPTLRLRHGMTSR